MLHRKNWVSAIGGLWLVCVQPALAEFSIQIGNPVAAQVPQAKMASFVFRTSGCADPAKVEVSGTAEGLVDGTRKTVPIRRITTAPVPGVYVVFREWPNHGTWLANVTGHCAAETAGALVVLGAAGVNREASKTYPRAATEAEIGAVLKTAAGK